VPIERPLVDLNRVLASPTLVLLSETAQDPGVMQQVMDGSRVTGNLVHDADIAALCLERGVSVRIPAQVDHPIHAKPITDSTASRSAIPEQADHLFHGKPITCVGMGGMGARVALESEV
jgi:hypothetical protein